MFFALPVFTLTFSMTHSPLFPEAMIYLGNGAEIKITANGNDASSRYVEWIAIDGKA